MYFNFHKNDFRKYIDPKNALTSKCVTCIWSTPKNSKKNVHDTTKDQWLSSKEISVHFRNAWKGNIKHSLMWHMILHGKHKTEDGGKEHNGNYHWDESLRQSQPPIF